MQCIYNLPYYFNTPLFLKIPTQKYKYAPINIATHSPLFLTTLTTRLYPFERRHSLPANKLP